MSTCDPVLVRVRRAPSLKRPLRIPAIGLHFEKTTTRMMPSAGNVQLGSIFAVVLSCAESQYVYLFCARAGFFGRPFNVSAESAAQDDGGSAQVMLGWVRNIFRTKYYMARAI